MKVIFEMEKNTLVCRYYYPFPPMGPLIYHMELCIGGQQFIGRGRTRQLAKHDAAAKALRMLHKEPILQQLPVVRQEEHGKIIVECIDAASFLTDTLFLLLKDEWRAGGGEPQQIRNQPSV